MAKGSTPKVNVPEYSRPTPDSFSSPYGNVKYENGGYNYFESPDQAAFTTQLQATRAALLKTIGSTSQDQQNSLDQWQKTYFDEANRLSQPRLEQSLFDRGLGGGSFYSGSLNDLITKNSNQAILNKYTLANQDASTKLANFNAIDSAYNTGNQNAYNLLNFANTNGANQDSLATSRYQATLPYLVTYDAGKQKNGYGQLIGTVGGGIAGAFAGDPMMGAQIGSTIGGGIDAGMGNQSVGGDFINSLSQYGGGFNSLISQKPAMSTGAFGKAGSVYNAPSSSFLNGILSLKK